MSGDAFLQGLEHLAGSKVPTYYSTGAKARAEKLSNLAEDCVHFIDEFFESKIQNRLLVLSERDWKSRIEYPYGLIAGKNNYLWYPIAEKNNPVYMELMPYYDNSPEPLKRALEELLGDSGDPYLTALLNWWEVTMVHEYMHNYAREDRIFFGLRWFEEFFADYFTCAYLNRHKNTMMRELRLFELLSRIMYEGGRSIVKYTSLSDLEKFYVGVGAANYCWYHGLLNIGAIDLYDVYGEDFIRHVIEAYKPSNEGLVQRLEATHRGLGAWFREWLAETP